MFFVKKFVLRGYVGSEDFDRFRYFQWFRATGRKANTWTKLVYFGCCRSITSNRPPSSSQTPQTLSRHPPDTHWHPQAPPKHHHFVHVFAFLPVALNRWKCRKQSRSSDPTYGGSIELFDKNQNHPLFNAVCLYSHVQLTGVTPSPNAVEFFHNPSVSNFWLLPLSWKEEEYE